MTTNQRINALLERFQAHLPAGVQLQDLEGLLRVFVKGSAKDQAQAQAIVQDVLDALDEVKAGNAPPSYFAFALKHGLNRFRILVDTKVMRLQRAAVDHFYSAVKLFLARHGHQVEVKNT